MYNNRRPGYNHYRRPDEELSPSVYSKSNSNYPNYISNTSNYYPNNFDRSVTDSPQLSYQEKWDYSSSTDRPTFARKELVSYDYQNSTGTRSSNTHPDNAHNGAAAVNISADRATSPATAQHVILQRKEKRRNCWNYLLLALLLIVCLILLLCILLFFLYGKRQVPVPAVDKSAQKDVVDVVDSADMLVSASFVLTALITQRDLCLFDATAGSRTLFDKEHIKGAKWFDFARISNVSDFVQRRLTHPLEFQEYVRSLGVDNDCHVVFYDRGDDQTFSIKWATYGYWVFKMFGHDKVSVMVGGLRGWRNQRQLNPEYELGSTTGPETIQSNTGDFVARWEPSHMALYEDVVDNFNNGQFDIVDSRSPDEYSGKDNCKNAKEPGRIKGAVNIPLGHVYNDSTSLFNSLDELNQNFATAGLRADKEALVYCCTGVRASAMWFALQMVKHRARVYAGSWVEYSHRAPNNLIIKSDGN